MKGFVDIKMESGVGRRYRPKLRLYVRDIFASLRAFETTIMSVIYLTKIDIIESIVVECC